MLTQERQQKILELVRQEKLVRVNRLAESLSVSEATIRRDLDYLNEAGLLQRTHGGALVPTTPSEAPVIHRMNENAQAKRRIGKAAVDLIKDGETIFIGSGTTTYEVARNLVDRQNLTIITNSLLVINTLAPYDNINLIAVGGTLRKSEHSFIGYLAEQALRELHPTKVFMGIRAISTRYGLSNDSLSEVGTDRMIFNSASKVILVADSTKFEKVATVVIAPVSVLSVVITDELTPQETILKLREENIEVILV